MVDRFIIISPGKSSRGEDSTGEGVWIAPLLAGGVFEAKDLIMMEFSLVYI